VRAAVFSVTSCADVHFEIMSGPTVVSGPAGTTFGAPLGTTAMVSPTSDYTPPKARIWISYTGTNADDMATGTVTIRCVETEENFEIDITTNTIARPTAAVVLALDKSNSMNFISGLAAPLDHRIDVLRFSAPPFVEVIQENNAIGVVSFDHEAYPVMEIAAVGPPSPFDGVRVAAKAAIASHTPNPLGNTAIGDAVELAHMKLQGETGYDVRAMIVLTDGHETASRYIAEVADEIIGSHVFAIGLGTADQIRPAALTQLTNGTGGYLRLTGQINEDNLFLLSKYYLQILAGVTNEDIVLDPEGRLRPGQRHRIPFRLNEADISSDVILLAPAPELFKFVLETPSGDLIDPAIAAVTPGMTHVVGSNVGFYRMTLPVPIGDAGASAGQWHAVLTMDEKNYKRHLARLDNYPKLRQSTLAHGVRYSLNVHTYSNLRMRASLAQNSYEPGATLTLRAILTEYGLPVARRATVRAELKRPDNSTAMLTLTEVEPGIFETTVLASSAGIYHFIVRANGTTLRGQPFTREQIVTGAVWKGGDQPLPTTTNDPHERDQRLCRLLTCLLSQGNISPELESRLRQLGINLEGVRKCLKAYCVNPASRADTPTTNAGPEILALFRPEVIAELQRFLCEAKS